MGDFEMPYEIGFPPDVNKDEIEAEYKKPSLIEFTVETLAKKAVEIKGIWDGEPAEGYMGEPMIFDFEQIQVTGSKQVVDAISYAQVVITRTNLDKTVVVESPYTLMDENGEEITSPELKSDTEVIEVTLPIVKSKEIPLTIEFVDGGGATSEDVIVDIKPKSVIVSGDATVLDGISKIVLDKLDLSTIPDNTTLSLPIVIPNDVKNVSGAEIATVSIKIKGLETKVIRASNMEFVNVPEDFVAESMTQMLQITVRASEADIENIADNHLRVVADLSEITKAGSYMVPVTVWIDGFEDAGVMGEYTIVVSLEDI